MKTLHVHIERLANALASKGLRLKRHNLLEVAAAAFGYHTSNAAQSADARGDLKPASVERICRTTIEGEDLLVLRDPIAGAMYAVATSKLGTKKDSIGITPYGNLVGMESTNGDVGNEPVANADAPEQVIHIAMIHHSHGVDIVSGRSMAHVSKEVARYARDNWYEAYTADQSDDEDRLDLPEDHESLNDDRVESLYFEAISKFDPGNYVEYQTIDIPEPTSKALDPRYRSYPSTSNPAEPVEADYHSAHGTLKEAIACSLENRRGGFDCYVVDHVGREFWRASRGWVRETFPA